MGLNFHKSDMWTKKRMEENKTKINTNNNMKTVRTYMSDMADTVRANEISVIKVALAEQNRQARENLYREQEETPTKKIFWFIGGIILIGGAIFGSTFLINKKVEVDTPIAVLKESAIISYDEIYNLNISEKENLSEKISEIKDLPTKNNFITFISVSKEINNVKEKISTTELFSRFKMEAPGSLVRSLSDNYMMGMFTKEINSTNDKKSIPFIIFQSNDYEFTYAGMLEWEKTLAGDIQNILKLNTKNSIENINEIKWKDLVLNNKDSRVLYNENNEPILYYIFADKKNLVITESKDAIKEIISRLAINNIKSI